MDQIHPQWPIYFKEMIHTKDKLHHVGIVTLWSKKEIYVDRLDCNFNTIGQLYSREQGLSCLVRNLLANRHITDLILVGVDMNNCGPALKALFENGVDEKNVVLNCEHVSSIEKEIPLSAINEIRSTVKLHDLRTEKDFGKISEYIKNIPKNVSDSKIQTYPEAELVKPENFPSSGSGQVIYSKYAKDVWFKLLKTVNKLGKIKKSQYGEDQREAIAITTVISAEDPDNPEWTDLFPFTKEELLFYYPQVITPNYHEGLEYTYGQRMMDHEGINQIDSIVEQLKKENFTRRAVVCLWDVKKDNNSSKPPCVTLVNALVNDNKLHLTTYMRSNDVYGAWPRNSLALRKLQKIILERVGNNLQLGNLSIVLNSAHFYKRDFNKINEIIEKTKNKMPFEQDPNGTLVITIMDNEIVVEHLDPNGKKLDLIKGKTAIQLYKKISNELKISDISHAMDIGAELQKAEIALKLGVEYKQDQPLSFEKINQ